MTDLLALTHATERDIDLLLLEEFLASPPFVAWVLEGIGLGHLAVTRAGVMHSTRRLFNRREIDISVEIETQDGSLLLLIENKLDASDQPGQAQSYRAEAKELAAKHHSVVTIIACPEAYATGNADFVQAFDHQLSYEAIAAHFEARAETGELAARVAHRARVMRQAIDKQRRRYVQMIHPAKRAFTERYVALLKDMAPTLIPGPSMLRDSAAESVTMIFAPETLPRWPFLPQMRIVHQLREENANISFYTWGDRFADLVGPISMELAGTGIRAIPSVNKRQGGRSGLMLVVNTPAVDHFMDFDEQLDVVQKGITETLRLRDWFAARESVVSGWASLMNA